MENLRINLFSITFFNGSAEDVSVELYLVKLSNNFTTAVFSLLYSFQYCRLIKIKKLTIRMLDTSRVVELIIN